jgi:hypothetical protein
MPLQPLGMLLGGATIAYVIFALPEDVARDFEVFVDRDCAAFATQREAQRFYELHAPGDPHGLDRDRDGLACEWNP